MPCHIACVCCGHIAPRGSIARQLAFSQQGTSSLDVLHSAPHHLAAGQVPPAWQPLLKLLDCLEELTPHLVKVSCFHCRVSTHACVAWTCKAQGPSSCSQHWTGSRPVCAATAAARLHAYRVASALHTHTSPLLLLLLPCRTHGARLTGCTLQLLHQMMAAATMLGPAAAAREAWTGAGWRSCGLGAWLTTTSKCGVHAVPRCSVLLKCRWVPLPALHGCRCIAWLPELLLFLPAFACLPST